MFGSFIEQVLAFKTGGNNSLYCTTTDFFNEVCLSDCRFHFASVTKLICFEFRALIMLENGKSITFKLANRDSVPIPCLLYKCSQVDVRQIRRASPRDILIRISSKTVENNAAKVTKRSNDINFPSCGDSCVHYNSLITPQQR